MNICAKIPPLESVDHEFFTILVAILNWFTQYAIVDCFQKKIMTECICADDDMCKNSSLDISRLLIAYTFSYLDNGSYSGTRMTPQGTFVCNKILHRSFFQQWPTLTIGSSQICGKQNFLGLSKHHAVCL